MAVPRGAINARIVRIERPRLGYGNDPAGVEKVLLRDVPANRQPSAELLRDEINDKEERATADFFIDLPADPFAIRVGDRLVWRRLANGVPTGDEVDGAEVRIVEVNDHPVRLSHVRLVTRGGDGTGA